MERFKWRIQLLMALLVLVASSVLTAYYIYYIERHATERAEISSRYTSTVYSSLISDMEHTYKYRAYGNLLISGFKEALIKQDREKLYALLANRYKTMQEENSYLKIMQIHAPNGQSILRVHEKDKFGDFIADRRPMVQRAHRLHTVQSGFEGGIAGVAYRVIVPYFDNEKYIGAVEFGIDSEYIVNKIETTTGMKSVFLLHDSRTAAAEIKDYPNQFGLYRLIKVVPEQYELIKLYMEGNPGYSKKLIHYNNKYYEINPIHLNGNDGHEMGMFLCINDITAGYHDISETIMGSLLITFILILSFVGINESAFRYIMKKVRFNEEYIETIFNSQKNIIVVTDGTQIIYVNQSFLTYFNYQSLEEFKRYYKCICDTFEFSVYEHYLQPEIDGLRWTEYVVKHDEIEHKAQITVNEKTSTFAVNVKKMIQDEETRYVSVFDDITELNQLATRDQLTKIANRFSFDEIFEHSIALAKRYEKVFSILLVDIDHFKKINDEYGHLVGDEVLKSFSGLLKQQIRDSDIVARWGGEEFMILLPNTPLVSAVKMAEALCHRIEIHPFEQVNNVTCSIGVAEYTIGEEGDSLLSRVDEKLYLAKNNGRNQVVF